MAHGLSGILEYEEIRLTAPDMIVDVNASESNKLKGNGAYYTMFVPEQAGQNALSVWTSMVDAAWGIREPEATAMERGIWVVMRSFMAHAFFEMSVPAVVAHCQILCKKLGFRCNPNKVCQHYPHEAENGETSSEVKPGKRRYEHAGNKSGTPAADMDPLIN